MKAKKDTILHQTQNGYVLKCNCCNEIQIAFGNIILKNDYEQFITFKQCIDNVEINRTCDCQLPNNKQFVLKLPCDMAIGFTKDEIIELRQLLAEAEATLSINSLIQEIWHES